MKLSAADSNSGDRIIKWITGYENASAKSISPILDLQIGTHLCKKTVKEIILAGLNIKWRCGGGACLHNVNAPIYN